LRIPVRNLLAAAAAKTVVGLCLYFVPHEFSDHWAA
jgi:hypothetical protein